jgi:hypothetical protein
MEADRFSCLGDEHSKPLFWRGNRTDKALKLRADRLFMR